MAIGTDIQVLRRSRKDTALTIIAAVLNIWSIVLSLLFWLPARSADSEYTALYLIPALLANLLVCLPLSCLAVFMRKDNSKDLSVLIVILQLVSLGLVVRQLVASW